MAKACGTSRDPAAMPAAARVPLTIKSRLVMPFFFSTLIGLSSFPVVAGVWPHNFVRPDPGVLNYQQGLWSGRLNS
jgi:hypothetical protein